VSENFFSLLIRYVYHIFPGKYWFDIEDIYPKNELIGWLDPKMDIFLSQFDDGILFANDGDDADPMLLSLSHQPLFQGPYFDGFPAISLKHHNSHVLYIISIGQHQKVPQLWQIDIPNGDNKKQVFLAKSQDFVQFII
jgi:hypothetical protein